MLSLSAATRVLVAIEPVDLRGSFNPEAKRAPQMLKCCSQGEVLQTDRWNCGSDIMIGAVRSRVARNILVEPEVE